MGLGIAAISYDSVPVLRHFADRKGIRIPLLSDANSRIIRDFGILNEQVPKENFAYGIPHPVVYLVNSAGVVEGRYFEQDYRQRFTVSGILLRRFGVSPQADAGQAEAKHLTVRSTASAAIVRGGQRLALMLEIEVKPGFHVYAPGQEDYIPIAWNLAASGGWTAGEVAFPAAKRISVEGLGNLQVYDGKLLLARDLTIGSANTIKPLLQGAELAVAGTLRYQACDDRQCFPPESVPLEWKFTVESHDTERVPAELRRR